MIFMEHDLYQHKRKKYNFDSYNVFLSITENGSVLLKADFLVQGHIIIYLTFVMNG